MKNLSLSRITNWALLLAALTAVLQFAACDTAPPPQAETRQAFGLVFPPTARTYNNTDLGDLEKVYHVDYKHNKTLRAEGYTLQAAKDSFPTFAAFWEAHGWPTTELLDLGMLECAWNDAEWAGNTYYGHGINIRPDFVSQARVHIKAPDGKYTIYYPCMTGLGRYTGTHAQLSSDATGTLPGGTGIEIGHAGWSIRSPERVCLMATAWGKDYGVIGGVAYTEGIIIEHFRFMGAKAQAGTFTGFSTAVTLNEPGENSVMRYCMAEDFKGAGYTVFNGTHFECHTCSAFECTGPGFRHLSSNGLCSVTWIIPSGDNNAGGLMSFEPKSIAAGDVGTGSHQIIGLKAEARNVIQIPIVITGPVGDLNMTINGMTANAIGVRLPYLIGGNWTGTQFEVFATGIDLRDNTDALLFGNGKLLRGGKPFSGNSFGLNDEGLFMKSRANMTWSAGTPTCQWVPGVETCSTCTNGTQTCTTPSVPSIAGCSPSGTKPADVTRTQTCTVVPPPSTMSAKASHTGTETGLLREAKYITDGDPRSFWISGRSMTADGTQWVEVDYGSTAVRSSVAFDIANGYSNSYPRKFDVLTSTNAVTWTTTKTGVLGAYPTCSTTFPGVSCRYVRVVCREANSNWWAVQAWR